MSTGSSIRSAAGRMPESVKHVFRAIYLGVGKIRAIGRRILGLPGDKQLLVCGFPRGGTSLFYNMLSTSLRGFEFTSFEYTATRLIHRFGNSASKTPLDILLLDQLFIENIHRKELLVFIIVRDPRDLVTSKHPMLPDRYFIGYDHSWWPQNREFSEWEYHAAGIGEIYGAICRAQKVHSKSVMTISYEDLCADADLVQKLVRKKRISTFIRRFPSSIRMRGLMHTGTKENTRRKMIRSTGSQHRLINNALVNGEQQSTVIVLSSSLHSFRNCLISLSSLVMKTIEAGSSSCVSLRSSASGYRICIQTF